MSSNITRKEFIKGTLVAGISTSLAGPYIMANKLQSRSKKVIIAGAGISGLCCGYELMKAGHDVTVLEATGRSGGHVFTGHDGLTEGLNADFGADHLTKPGYERFFEYVKEFDLPVIPYPNAEGSPLPRNSAMYKLIDGKFYTRKELSTPKMLKKEGFNSKEIKFLSKNPRYRLRSFYLQKYVDKFTDPNQPYGVGLDHLDSVPIAKIYKKEGASQAALKYLGGQSTNALYSLWRLAVMGFRGIPLSEGKTYRLQGGNQQLPNVFAERLGSRVKLKHPVVAIDRSNKGVTVTYREYGNDKKRTMDADFLVNCITLPVFSNIPVNPPLSPEKQYVVNNLNYTSHPFYVFEASSEFWLNDGFKTINMEFDHPDISSIWLQPNKDSTNRIILKAYGPGGISPQRVLKAFREVYPGNDTIVQALTKDWTRDAHAPFCEMEPFPIGEMHKFWPEILKPDGRIYFAGTYADSLSRGMESCIRSAQRVAREIDKA
ncbi:MAG TPA: NAD(P)/FAD-dependent oxidoreductase [Balneolaceae bacterium]|nr:NAD(P)/FAD-dependent oxidoreductase [Balneolaceae bacterium]